MNVLEWLGFKKSEKNIYNTLLRKKKSMGIKDIAEHAKMSERAVRYSIKKLLKKRFIKRNIFQDKRLMYKYTALPIKNAWKHFKKRVDKMLGKRGI